MNSTGWPAAAQAVREVALLEQEGLGPHEIAPAIPGRHQRRRQDFRGAHPALRVIPVVDSGCLVGVPTTLADSDGLALNRWQLGLKY